MEKQVLPIHGDQHCPGGPDPIPCLGINWPWIGLQNPGQTLADSATLSPSLMTDLYWDPALVTEPQNDLDEVFVVDLESSGGTDYWAMTNRVEGWFMVEMVHEIEQGGAGGADDWFKHQITASPTGMAFPQDNIMGGAGEWSNTGGSQIEVYPRLESYRLLWLPLSQVQMIPRIAQTSGSDKGVGGHVKFFYLGGIGGSSDNADWEFAAA